MTQNANSSLPPHLTPLLGQTASGFAKFCAAWEGLSMESQILFIEELERLSRLGVKHRYASDIFQKALGSDYPYVRYLAARRFCFDSKPDIKPTEWQKRIEEDPCELVRYAPLEDHSFFDESLNDQDAFFRLPHAARLARMRDLRGSGEVIANLLLHGLDHQIKGHELYQILSEYLENGQFSSYYGRQVTWDGSADYQRGRDIESLWHVLPKASGGIAFLLLAHLPESAGLAHGIPNEVLDVLSEKQLIVLLSRPDLALDTLRKRIFFDPGEKRPNLRIAAVSHNFSIENDQFAEILASPEKELRRFLSELVCAASLRPCIAEAIQDYLHANKGSEIEWEERSWTRRDAERNLLASLKEIKSPGDSRISELRIYRLAKGAAPWQRDSEGYLPNELEWLRELVVKGNPWATFIKIVPRLEMACRYHGLHDFESRSQWEKIAKLLPRIEEVDGAAQAEATEPAEKQQVEHLTGEIKRQVEALAREIKEDLGKRLSDCTSGVATFGRSLEQSTADQTQRLEKKFRAEKDESLSALHVQFSELRMQLSVLRLLLLVSLGVLFWLLVRR